LKKAIKKEREIDELMIEKRLIDEIEMRLLR